MLNQEAFFSVASFPYQRQRPELLSQVNDITSQINAGQIKAFSFTATDMDTPPISSVCVS
jgi:hypothetical protein